MQIDTIQNNTQQTTANISDKNIKLMFQENIKNEKDSVELSTDKQEQPKRSLTAKKWGVGIASFALPGTGQLINGQVTKGLGLFGLYLGSGLLAGLGLSNRSFMNFSPTNLTKLKSSSASKGGTALMAAGTIGALVTKVYSIVNAVNNTKPDKE